MSGSDPLRAALRPTYRPELPQICELLSAYLLATQPFTPGMESTPHADRWLLEAWKALAQCCGARPRKAEGLTNSSRHIATIARPSDNPKRARQAELLPSTLSSRYPTSGSTVCDRTGGLDRRLEVGKSGQGFGASAALVRNVARPVSAIAKCGPS